MPPLDLILTMLAMLLATGAFAGLLAGLLGVGGGIVLVPAYFYIFVTLGYDTPSIMRVCLATSLATIIATSARSVLAHHRKGAVDWGILRDWAPGIALGALAGVVVVAWLKTAVLQAIFGGLALCVALYLGLGRADWRVAERMPGLGQRLVLSPLVGFLSVLMGIGGGSFGVPVMTLHGVPIHRAVATAAGFGITIALPSAVAFLLVPVPDAPPWTLGAVNLPAFLITIAMTLITAPMGAALAHRTDAGRLRRIFAGFLAIVALNMLRKAAGW
ncbi:sulfite exporter TauE/SafE family protein [Frigidibacter oleivorans]|uniref:sulfite exporter TauE/SafE family protein n=1 Tax=Frigidibacter oleivorans TaxID=2487129 RepID=UPI000F8C8156|nr:sulfite exporter TauE/SafE family protein [Frigidibacter oleivorans]